MIRTCNTSILGFNGCKTDTDGTYMQFIVDKRLVIKINNFFFELKGTEGWPLEPIILFQESCT